MLVTKYLLAAGRYEIGTSSEELTGSGNGAGDLEDRAISRKKAASGGLKVA